VIWKWSCLLLGLYGFTEKILFSMGHMPHWLDGKMSLVDEIMHMFVALGAYIRMPKWPLAFMTIGRQGCDVALKITLNR
jgi:hypothetical protein